jgi:hypothetical protein
MNFETHIQTCINEDPSMFEIQLPRKSGNFGHGFILSPKYEVPKLNTPKYVTLQKLIAKIEHCLNISLYLYSLICTFLS